MGWSLTHFTMSPTRPELEALLGSFQIRAVVVPLDAGFTATVIETTGPPIDGVTPLPPFPCDTWESAALADFGGALAATVARALAQRMNCPVSLVAYSERTEVFALLDFDATGNLVRYERVHGHDQVIFEGQGQSDSTLSIDYAARASELLGERFPDTFPDHALDRLDEALESEEVVDIDADDSVWTSHDVCGICGKAQPKDALAYGDDGPLACSNCLAASAASPEASERRPWWKFW